MYISNSNTVFYSDNCLFVHTIQVIYVDGKISLSSCDSNFYPKNERPFFVYKRITSFFEKTMALYDDENFLLYISNGFLLASLWDSCTCFLMCTETLRQTYPAILL